MRGAFWQAESSLGSPSRGYLIFFGVFFPGCHSWLVIIASADQSIPQQFSTSDTRFASSSRCASVHAGHIFWVNPSNFCLRRRGSWDETHEDSEEHCRPAAELGRDHVQPAGNPNQPQVGSQRWYQPSALVDRWAPHCDNKHITVCKASFLKFSPRSYWMTKPLVTITSITLWVFTF